MFKRALITALLIATALAANGTTPVAALSFVRQEIRPIPSVPSTVDMSAVPGDSGEEFKEEFHQTYPLSLTGRVGLENINGGVQIRVWDRAAVQVDAVKKAYRRERLAEAQIEVNSSEDNIHIKTEYPNWDNRSGRWDRSDNPASVEYSLTIPRKAVLESIELVNGSVDIEGAEGSVKVSSINGHVNATGLMGDVKLSTINGPLKATFVSLGDTRPISLGSVNGNVTLVIPSDANASIRAGTVHGDISNDFGLKVKHGEYVGHNLDGQIGSGGPRIKLGNVNGAIIINHAQDGKPLSPATSLVADLDHEKEKYKEKEKEEYKRSLDEDIARSVEQSTATATAIAAAEIERVNAAKIAREAQQQVDRALRDAQREIERAQREVQRENERQIREQVREQVRVVNAGRGRGVGAGYGDNRVSAQETKTFTVSGSPNVNLATFDGSVTVHGWDRSEVKYIVTKRAGDEEGLGQIGIRADQQGSSVSVIATSDINNSSAELEVWVPRKTSLHVSSDDGGLKVEGVTGDITLRTGDGGIDVNDGAGQLQLNTGDGQISVFKFDGELDARTGDGAIRLDGNFNALTARTGDGAISLTVPSNSNFTVETNAEGDVTNHGLTLAEDIAPSKRVRRWRIGNGGKVFVLNTGDGQIVLRSR